MISLGAGEARGFIIVPGGGGDGPVVTAMADPAGAGSFTWSGKFFTDPGSVSRGNDNTGGTRNTIYLKDFTFNSNDYVDIELTVVSHTSSTPATEYRLGIGTDFEVAATSIVNSTASAWSGFQLRVGVRDTAGNLTPVSGLDFDTPDVDPTPGSNVFTLFQNFGHTINFLAPPSPIPGDGSSSSSHFFVSTNLDIPNLSTEKIVLRMQPLLQSAIGQSQDNPILQDNVDRETGAFVFTGATSGRWYDPPAYGFDFVMDTLGAGFASVTLPLGFDPVTVVFGMTTLTGVLGGTTINLGGVTTFSILGINPPADSDNPASYPVLLTFTQDPVNFRMIPILTNQAIPEPASVGMCGILSLVGWLGWYRQKKRRHNAGLTT
jgi:hypothetical protein